MLRRSLSGSLWAVALCALCTLGTGCSSNRASESEAAVDSMQETLDHVDSSRSQVNHTLTTLDKLSGGGDLQKAFDEYVGSVGALKTSAAEARQRAQAMKDRGKEFIAKWQAESANVENPSIKQAMEERKARVQAHYDDISKAAQEIRDAYQPFMKNLEEIQKALSLDLSANGIKSLQPAMGQAKMQGQTLMQKMDKLHKELADVKGGMAPMKH